MTKDFFDEIKKVYPNCEVIKRGKKIEQIYEVSVKANDKRFDNIYYVKETSIFSSEGESYDIPKIEVIGVNNRFLLPLITKEIHDFQETSQLNSNTTKESSK